MCDSGQLCHRGGGDERDEYEQDECDSGTYNREIRKKAGTPGYDFDVDCVSASGGKQPLLEELPIGTKCVQKCRHADASSTRNCIPPEAGTVEACRSYATATSWECRGSWDNTRPMGGRFGECLDEECGFEEQSCCKVKCTNNQCGDTIGKGKEYEPVCDDGLEPVADKGHNDIEACTCRKPQSQLPVIAIVAGVGAALGIASVCIAIFVHRRRQQQLMAIPVVQQTGTSVNSAALPIASATPVILPKPNESATATTTSTAAATPSTKPVNEQLAELVSMRKDGMLSEEEFTAAKAKVLERV